MILRCLVAAVILFSVHLRTDTQASEPAPNPSCSLKSFQTSVRPDANGPPTQLKVGIWIADLLEINDVNQTLTVDIAINRVWKDARLAQFEGCKLPIGSIWFPELVVMNSGRLFERWPETATIGPGGEVTYLQRISGTIASYHRLDSFPFDQQSIAVSFFPLEYDISEVVLVADEMFMGIGERLNISDWNINGFNVSIAPFRFDALPTDHARLDFTIEATRIRSFYLWKVILPLILIVFMSWAVFWINADKFGPQIGLSATSMLTLIAFIFATTSMLPELGYFMLLDWFIGISTITVFLGLLISLLTSHLISLGRPEKAEKINQACRVIFPAGFLVATAAVLYPAV